MRCDARPEPGYTASATRSPAWSTDDRNATLDDDQDGLTNLEEYLNTLAS